jgi:hypothetical protein
LTCYAIKGNFTMLLTLREIYLVASECLMSSVDFGPQNTRKKSIYLCKYLLNLLSGLENQKYGLRPRANARIRNLDINIR